MKLSLQAVWVVLQMVALICLTFDLLSESCLGEEEPDDKTGAFSRSLTFCSSSTAIAVPFCLIYYYQEFKLR